MTQPERKRLEAKHYMRQAWLQTDNAESAAYTYGWRSPEHTKACSAAVFAASQAELLDQHNYAGSRDMIYAFTFGARDQHNLPANENKAGRPRTSFTMNKNHDFKLVLQLWGAGMNDYQIAVMTDIPRTTICNWRRRNGLIATGKAGRKRSIGG